MWGLPKPNFKPHEYWPSEARCCNSAYRLRYWNIKINTCILFSTRCNSAYRLRYWNLQSYPLGYYSSIRLQQCLPFTVLKLTEYWSYTINNSICCNSAYRLRYWNSRAIHRTQRYEFCCNSAYRLRYWNSLWIQRNCWPQVNRCNSAYRLRYWNEWFL